MKKKYIIFLIALSGFLFGSAGAVKAQSPLKGTSFGKGLKVMAPDSSFSMKFHMRFQTLFVAEQVLEDTSSDLTTQLLTRRARLKFEGFAFQPNIEYKVELGLTNRDIGKPINQTGGASNIILDAVVKWEPVKNLEVWFGQTKLPGNRERVISSQALQFVDRSIVNSEFNIDRDIGVQLHYSFNVGKALFRTMGSVSQGEGRNITVINEGGYGYTGRVEILPFGKFESKGDYVGADVERHESPRLSIAGGYDYNVGASREQGQLGKFLPETRDLGSVIADMMFKYRGISVMAEYMSKTTGSPLLVDTAGNVLGAFVTGTGISAQSGYVFKNMWEIAGRYSTVIPDEDISEDAITQYTLGVSKYIKGHNLKVQSDVSYTEVENSDNPELMFRFQVELGF